MLHSVRWGTVLEKSDDILILELESLLSQGGRPSKEEKESVTLRISAPLARKAKQVFENERSAIYEESLIRAMRLAGHLPPPLSSSKAGGGAHAYFNPPKDGPAPDSYIESAFQGETPTGRILKEQDGKRKKPKK